MVIAQRIQQVLAKNPNKITLDHQKLEFGRKAEAPTRKRKISTAEATAWAKATWAARLAGVTQKKN
jgi:hypothetical protein